MVKKGTRNILGVQRFCLITKVHPRVLENERYWEYNLEILILKHHLKYNIETFDHFASIYLCWINNLYLAMHDNRARNLHYWLCKKYNSALVSSETAPPILENVRAAILWNPTIRTVTLMDHRKPNLCFSTKK